MLALVYRLLVTQQRTAALQAQRVLLQANLRSAAAFISTDLRDVSTDSASLDLLAFAPESSPTGPVGKRNCLPGESDVGGLAR